MADHSPPPTTPHLPTDKQQGIGAALKHALMFTPAMTDVLIHEGDVIRAKSARGTLPLHELSDAIAPFVVTREHIVNYLAGHADGSQRQHRDGRGHTLSAQEYWDSRIKPALSRQRALHFRLDGRGGHALRYTLFLHRTGELGLVMRVTRPGITPLAALGLPQRLVSALTGATSGFIVISGPSGAGKSESAMSLLDWHNASHSGHIVTIEDPIEKRLPPRKAVVTQREVGHDVLTFADGLRDALRMCPDVLLASEIADAASAEQAIRAGESGALMVATTQARSCTGALRKILSHTGPDVEALRSVLAGSLVAVVRQALVPAKQGDRYHLVADVLLNDGRVTALIERGDWIGLDGLMTGDGHPRSNEWMPMNTRLAELVACGDVEASEAMRETSDIPDLRRKLADAHAR